MKYTIILDKNYNFLFIFKNTTFLGEKYKVIEIKKS